MNNSPVAEEPPPARSCRWDEDICGVSPRATENTTEENGVFFLSRDETFVGARARSSSFRSGSHVRMRYDPSVWLSPTTTTTFDAGHRDLDVCAREWRQGVATPAFIRVCVGACACVPSTGNPPAHLSLARGVAYTATTATLSRVRSFVVSVALLPLPRASRRPRASMRDEIHASRTTHGATRGPQIGIAIATARGICSAIVFVRQREANQRERERRERKLVFEFLHLN